MSRSLSNDNDPTSQFGTDDVGLQDLGHYHPTHQHHVYFPVDDCGTGTESRSPTRPSPIHENISEDVVAYENVIQPASKLRGRSLLTDFRRKILLSGPSGYRRIDPPQRWTLGLHGWRLGLLVSTIALFLCLLVEIILLATALGIERANNSADVLFEGPCDKVKKYTLLTLIPFNLLGTLMIGCSNYVMQVISAPSRKEIDTAHNHGEDLNIGISSSQNNKWIAPWKNRVWHIIGLTTIPIHLMLNSVVFATLQSNSYDIVIAGPDFINRNTSRVCGTSDRIPSTDDRLNTYGCMCCVYKDYAANSVRYANLDPTTCMEQYRNPLQATYSNMILITNGNETMWNEVREFNIRSITDDELNPAQLPFVTSSSSLTDWTQGSVAAEFSSFFYEGPPQKGLSRCVYMWNATNPTIECEFPDRRQTLGVEMCLSKMTEEHCTVRWSSGILVCILCCDLAKAMSMVFVLNKVVKRKHNIDKDDEIVAVLGDAIVSFMERPDETCVDRCLVDQKQIRANAWPMTANPRITLEDPIWKSSVEERILRFPDKFGPRPQTWKNQINRWGMAPSRTRWILFALPFAALFIATVVVFSSSLKRLDDLSFQNIWKQGLGKVDPSNVFALDVVQASLIRGAVVINSPQLLFSYLYFAYNGLFTCMCAGNEWSQFVDSEGRLLRVSSPTPRQRSTYWLSLPWRYTVPLIATSTLLHWLVSQSLFLVKIDMYGPDGSHNFSDDIAACGFSPMAMLLVLITCIVMFVVVIAFSRRKLKPGIPVVGTCSWAIAAACHDKGGHADATERPLRWGVTKEGDGIIPGHCNITSQVVTPLIVGRFYQ